jgi:hypothetical protein
VVLWWIGIVLLVFVVAPTVIFLLNRVIRPAYEIRGYADDILEHGVGITAELDAVPKLVRTKELTGAARQDGARYAAALRRLL